MMNIHYHLIEIKLRLFYLFLSTICTFLLGYNFQIEIVYIISKPFIELQQTFIFLQLTEAFYTLIKISTFLTILFIIPLFFYHVWSFFIPSFYNLERGKIIFFFFLVFFLFTLEIFIIYLIILPKICHFLISFEMSSEINKSDIQLEPLLSLEFNAQIGSYVELIVKLFTLILLLFQIPLCICYLYAKKFLYVSSLYFNRKSLCLLSLLISAFIVPPDITSQLIIAIFIYIIFEFLIFIGLFFE